MSFKFQFKYLASLWLFASMTCAKSDDSAGVRLTSVVTSNRLDTDAIFAAGWVAKNRSGQTNYLTPLAGTSLDFAYAYKEPHILPSRALNQYELPKSFDARNAWPNCLSLWRIMNQGRCASCWAVAGASVISDRICIASGRRNVDVQISVQQILLCNGESGNPCKLGLAKTPFTMFVNQGLVSGGDYNSKIGCCPYSAFTQEATNNITSQTCPHVCTNTAYPKTYTQDKYYGTKWYAMGNMFSGDNVVKQIQYEVMTKGPVAASLKVYSDFFDYESGVYRHATGRYVGGHTMKIIGWGTEEGRDYWLLANSWGTDWGMDGFVKVVRGENHLGIEGYIVTATA